ncbi:uncharacterized protein LOC130052579 [Ostrea edulis]|uniref:uncharacterized protein LOC130052579 n=1 Tax=Ostrea edulis TaxID=37623 RepID=UPI0024AE890F|nr:uncharacterized protein LOC130052579 [Ostrea edulis]
MSDGKLCTGLNRCCFGYRWNENLQDCIKCEIGFYGTTCGSKCKYPHYGEDCQHNCQCDSETCDFAIGCSNSTAATTHFTFERISQKPTTITPSQEHFGDSLFWIPDFKNLFLICASILGFVLLLNTLALVICLRRKYEKKKKEKKREQNYEDLEDFPCNVYSALNMDETNPCFEGSAIGKIRLLNHRYDNKYTLEIKTRPFQLNPTNCGLTETVPVSNSAPSPTPNVQGETEGNQQPSEYSSLDVHVRT